VSTALILIGFSVLLFSLPEPLLTLHRRWVQFDGAYSHGYLLVLVCSYLIVKPLPSLIANTEIRPWLAVFIGLPSLLWVFGYSTQVNVFQQLAYPMFLAALLLPFIGFKGLYKVSFPLGLLFLAIPIWEVLLPPLRGMTSVVATYGVRLLGIPAHIDGFSFSLPYGVVLIAGSCAGLSYFLMGVVLSGINSQYRGFNLKYTFLSVALMAVLSIIGNWIRVYALILIAYYSQMQSSLVYDHGNFGWWIFAGIFALYLFIIRGFPDGDFKKSGQAKALSPLNVTFVSTLALLLLFALTMPIVFKLSARQPLDISRYEVTSGSLRSISVKAGRLDFTPEFSNYDVESYWQSNLGEESWTLGRLVYAQQSQGKELISDGNTLTRLRVSHEETWLLSGYELKLSVIAPQQKLVLSTYLVGSRTETRPLAAKISQFTESIQGRPAVALLFASTDCLSPGCIDEIRSVKQSNNAIEQWLIELALYPPAG
jgi:exosortase